ncbi:Ppx/GppA family phosphatase [Aquibacillus sediminis]|uniref:Ppx/GppA family phosphatase n=1 Tax=Aquibacillus sediminis TaxID=2574734 RepID=UPI0011089EBF|nr:Ppx/GppA family phosphatase [Aquibacillus sediminis]
MSKNYYGMIDIGSNSMRLVIYLQEKTGSLSEVENVKAVARLRNHLDDQNLLTEQGLSILIQTLKSFKEVMETYELIDLVCVATASIRQAKNQDVIRQMVREQVGLDMKILSGEEEAFYGYLAVVNSTSITEGITVDIGGGSTEITYFKDRKLLESHSFSFGALTLNRFFKYDIPSNKELKKLREFLRDQFDSLPWLSQQGVPLIAIGGSARNLVQIDQSIKKYPLAGLHQYKMGWKDITYVSDCLSKLTTEEKQKVDGLSSDRADIILPAIEVFRCLHQTIGAKSFVLSRKGLRDGVFFEQLSQQLGSAVFPNVLQSSIQELMTDYDVNPTQINHVQFLASKFFDEFQQNGLGDLTYDDWTILKRASNVFNLGKYIDSESSAQHTFYLLANRTIDGLFHIDRLKLALVASFKNNQLFKQFVNPYKGWIAKSEKQKLRVLGALLKFLYCLDATKRQIVQDFDLRNREGVIELTIYCNQDWLPEQYQTVKQKKHLEKALKRPIHLTFVDVNEIGNIKLAR